MDGGTRVLVLTRGRYEGISRAHVLAEFGLDDEAEQYARAGNCVLARAVAELDPDWGDAVRAWDARDDSALRADELRWRAECEAEDVMLADHPLFGSRDWPGEPWRDRIDPS